jgi:hypothetical protein
VKQKFIHLGFEVGPSGSSVAIPIRHMVVTGQTQESGKTTTLEALIRRSELPAIAFRTKRGESSLAGRKVPPYFRERADWQFVSAILESTLKERMKFERAWIVRACQGCETLADVMRRTIALSAESRNNLSKDVYMLLGEYLQKVVPLVARLPKSASVDLRTLYANNAGELIPGLGVMDLVEYPEELQMLVIASTLEWIHKNAEKVITIIPEAWKFIPEAKNTPVKVVAEKLAREGAGIQNYLWIDSQDIAGVAKMILRGCAVWMIGVQREANEVKRAIENMPAGMKRPKPGDVSTLELGQFFCCHGHEIRKVYVQPAWMPEDIAARIAAGRISLEHIPTSVQEMKDKAAPRPTANEEDPVWKEKFEAEKERADLLQEQVNRLLQRPAAPAPAPEDRPAVITPPSDPAAAFTAGTFEGLYRRVMDAIRKDPVLIRLSQERPAIEVTIRKKVLSLDESTVKGKIARLIADGFFREPRDFVAIKAELVRRGNVRYKVGNVEITRPLQDLLSDGFFFREGNCYQSVPDAAVLAVNGV